MREKIALFWPKVFRTYFKVFLFVFRCGCVGITALALYFNYYDARLDSEGMKIQARFESKASQSDPNADRQGNFKDYSVLLFYDWNGARYSNYFKISVKDFEQVEEGRPVTIEVLPSDPQWSRLPGSRSSWPGSFLMICSALLILALSFILSTFLEGYGYQYSSAEQ